MKDKFESNAPTEEFSVAAAPAKASVGPFNLTTADRFVLKDTNNDGIPDIVVVERFDSKEAAERAAVEKYSAYHRFVASARAAAAAKNAGKSSLDITAAENVAEAEAKKAWKGPVPPASKPDLARVKAEEAAAKEKAAIAAELVRLSKF